MQPFNSQRRLLLTAAASSGLLTACGDSSTNPAVPASNLEKFAFIAQDPNTTSLAESNTASTSTAVFSTAISTKPVPTSFTSDAGTSKADLLFDDQGRPASSRNLSTGTTTQFFYPSATSMVIAEYSADRSLKTALAVWKAGDKYLAGEIAAVTARIPEDVASPTDITASVQGRMDELRAAMDPPPKLSHLLLRLLPMSSANAQTDSETSMRAFVLGVVGTVVLTVFPALVVGWALLALTQSAVIGALGLIATFLLLSKRAIAGTTDISQVNAIVAEYIARPYRGVLNITGSIKVPGGVNGTGGCSASFSTIGSVSVSLQAGNKAVTTIDGVEYISGSCFSQVFKKAVSATLTRTGNSLDGASGANPLYNNPYVFALALSADGLSIRGSIANPYNASNGFNGSAAGVVVLTR